MALYLDDSYAKECDATVVSVKDGKFIVLDKNVFYPTGGGQPHDTGKIVKDGEPYDVVFVGKFDGQISHEVNKEGLQKGDKVHCLIDWDRRYQFMKMHTTSHIIAAIFHKEANAMITGNQIGLEKTRFDFNIENFDREKIQLYVDHANDAIKRNLNVTISSMSKEEAMKKPGMVKLASGLPAEITELRIVQIGDVDEQADGGTHVKNTSEIGTIKLLSLENKGKNNRRLYFTLE